MRPFTLTRPCSIHSRVEAREAIPAFESTRSRVARGFFTDGCRSRTASAQIAGLRGDTKRKGRPDNAYTTMSSRYAQEADPPSAADCDSRQRGSGGVLAILHDARKPRNPQSR